MSDGFKLVEGGTECLTCPSCLKKIKLNSNRLAILKDSDTVRLYCNYCDTPLKVSYILKRLYIREA